MDDFVTDGTGLLVVLLVSGPITLHPDYSVSMASPFVKCRFLGPYPEASSLGCRGAHKGRGAAYRWGWEKVRWIEVRVEGN